MLLILPLELIPEKSDIMKTFQEYLEYSNYSSLMSHTPGELGQTLFFVFFDIHTLIILATVISGVVLFILGPKNTERHPSLKTICGTIFSTGTTLLSTILFLPMMFSFLSPLFCFDICGEGNNEEIKELMKCWGSFYYFNLALGLLSFLLAISVYCFSLFFMYDDFLYSSLPWAGEDREILVLRRINKMQIWLFLCINPSAENGNYAMIYFWVSLVYLQFRSLATTRFVYKSWVMTALLIQEHIMLSVYTYSLYHQIHFTNSMFVDILIVLLIGGILGVVVDWLKNSQKIKILFEEVAQIKIAKHSELFVRTLCWLSIWYKGATIWNVTLHHLLTSHQENCHDLGCACYKLRQLMDSSKRQRRDSLFIESKVTQENVWLLFIETLMLDEAKKWKQSQEIMLQIAYFEAISLKNYFKSYYWVIRSDTTAGKFHEKFRQFRMKQIIAKSIILQESKAEGTQGVEDILHFQKICLALQKVLQHTTNTILAFWKLFSVSRLNVQEIFNKARKVATLIKLVKSLFSKATTLSPNYPYVYFYYGYFLKMIESNSNEADEILEKGKEILKSHFETKSRTRESITKAINTAIIIANGNVDSLGSILRANQHVKEQLGFTVTDLEGRNLSRIMPTVIGEKHDEFMINHIKTGERLKFSQEELVFIQTKHGLVEPMCMLVKTLPCLQRGIRYIAFLRKDLAKIRNTYIKIPSQYKRAHMAFLLVDKHGILIGMSKYACSLFGLTPKYVMRKKGLTSLPFSVGEICPQFVNLSAEKQLQSGLIVQLNTSSIVEYLDHDYLKKEEEERLLSSVTANCQAYTVMLKISYKDTLNLKVFAILNLSRWTAAKYRMQGAIKFSNELRSLASISRLKNTPSLEAEQKQKIGMVEEKKSIRTPYTVKPTFLQLPSLSSTKKSSEQSNDSHSIGRIRLAIISFIAILLTNLLIVLFFFHSSMDDLKINHNILVHSLKRICSLNVVVYQIMGLLNIYNGLEPDYSDYMQSRSVALRVSGKAYLELLKEFTNNIERELLNSPLKKHFDEISGASLYVQKIETNFTVYKEHDTLITVMMEFVGSCSELLQISQSNAVSASYLNVFTTNSSINLTSSERCMYYVFSNSLSLIHKILSQSELLLLKYALADMDSDCMFLFYFHITNVGVIILFAILFVPILVNLRKTKINLLRKFAGITGEMLDSLIEDCKKYLNLHLWSLVHGNEDDEIPLAPIRENFQDKMSSTIHKNNQEKITSIKYPSSSIPSAHAGETEAEIEKEIEQHEKDEEAAQELLKKTNSEAELEIITERRRKINGTSIGFGQAGLVFILIFSAILGYYIKIVITHFYSFNTLETEINKIMNVYRAGTYLSDAVLFFRSYLKGFEGFHYTISGYDPYVYFGTIASRALSQKTLESDHFKDLEETLDALDTSAFCNIISDVYTSNITETWCKNIYNGIMKEGLNPSISYMMMWMRNEYLAISVSGGSETLKKKEMMNDDFIQLLLIFDYLVIPVFNNVGSRVNLAFQDLVDYEFLLFILDFFIICSVLVISFTILIAYFLKTVEEEIFTEQGSTDGFFFLNHSNFLLLLSFERWCVFQTGNGS